MAINPVPTDCPRVIPFLIVDGCAELIDFITTVFDAKGDFRMEIPGGPVMHASLRIGDSLIMMCDGNEKYPATTTVLYVYVPDVDATYQKAMRAGAKSIGEGPKDQFYGDRSGAFLDKWGNKWGIASRIEEVAPDEVKRRAMAMHS